MKQVITEPTHILESSASCIDLIFTNQPNIVMDSGVHLSLHEKCHHQIIYSKLNLRIEYPPPYIRKIWDYNRSETDSINRSIEIFDWSSLFSGKNVHEQVEVFNKTLLNIFHNFIPNKIILCDDKDPPWMNDEIKNLIKRKNWLFQCQRKSGNLDYACLNSITQDISNAVNSSKLKYHERLALNVNDPKTAPKTYWKILKTFVNGTKIPLIPPLLVGNQLVTDFLVKANLFNDYFSQQCMTVDNDSSIPPNITFATEQKLSTVEFCTDDIVKIIKSLDPNKAHGHDEISIRMIKLCTTSISKPLSILFRNCFVNQCFPNEWKKANIVPVHKKNDKQLIKNYRPVSLLPVCSKIFEKVIFNSLFKYLEDNNLLNGNQSGFRPGDSCVHQLLSITHEIYKAFDANPSLEVREVFLDLSKAFDKVWHDGLM